MSLTPQMIDCGAMNGEDKMNKDATEMVPLIQEERIVYKRRWFILLIFALNTMMTAILLISLSSVNSTLIKYYRTTPVQIEWLTNIFMISYVVLSIPASHCINRWGVRPVIMMVSLLNFICTLLHYFGVKRDRFWLVLFGQVFSATAHSAILQIPAKLSVLWFPETERATATCIGGLMNIFGFALGFLHPALMITGDDITSIGKQLKMFYISQIVVSAIVLLVTLGYREKPPTPPIIAIERENVKISDSLRSLWRNKYFIFLSQSYGIYLGLYIVIGVLLNPLITWRFDGKYRAEIGWMGFGSNVAAMFSFLVIGRLLDRFRRYRLTGFLLNFLSMVFWLLFILLLSLSNSFYALFGVFVIFGIFSVPFFAAGLEQAAEMTYPVSEEISSAVILLFANFYAFVFVYTLGLAAHHGYNMAVGYSITGLYILSTFLSYYAKTELNRLDSNSAME